MKSQSVNPELEKKLKHNNYCLTFYQMKIKYNSAIQ
jgi:hypothetical protein